jgi:hypothetical protein
VTTPGDRVRRLALALPEAVEADHHGRPSFRVAGRIFATLWDVDHMNVMLDEAEVVKQPRLDAHQPIVPGTTAAVVRRA